MGKKFLDQNGLLYLWSKITAKFVAKEEGKGLSTNDFTTAEKEKLSGIATGATKTVITNNLISTSTSNALSANQGKILNDKIVAINTSMENLGAGDMLKSVYDTNGDGVVDKADNATKLNGQPASYYAKAVDIPTVTNDYTDAEKDKVETASNHAVLAHAPYNAQANIIESVLVNGTEQTVTEKSVNISVPTKVSQLTNDKNYLTQHQDISGKADKATTLAGYGIGDAYTKTQIDAAISTAVANAGHLKRSIVTQLPAVSSADANTIYMVKDSSVTSGDSYKEYMLIDGALVQIGDTTVDLSDYMKTDDMVAITNAEIDTIVAGNGQ